ncbi:radical SAM protein [Candidatus Woesearchaeota archaeon]|nr:radical SAM protein [Candidatus Woesearchaeota archaeon]
MTLLLIHPPFCTPAGPPYALAYLYSFLTHNSSKPIKILDLNLIWHQKRFPQFYQYSKTFPNHFQDYDQQSHTFLKDSAPIYSENHKRIRAQQDPDLLNEMVEEILQHKPTTVAFSVTYSSQAFYTLPLLQKLKEHNIKTIVGGGALTKHLKEAATLFLQNEVELLNYLEQHEIDHNELKPAFPLDFTAFPLNDYFTPQPVFPLKTTVGCYYMQCAFCSHHQNKKYTEFSLEDIEATIKLNKMKYVFFIDEMIHKKRLLDLAAICKKYDVQWICQLRPMKDLDKATLQTLHDGGLRIVVWGMESASQRILDLMKKGTNVSEALEVIKNAHEVGICNGLYIMFGFPTETKEEFIQTVEFLKKNTLSYDLILTSIFGLQKGTPAFTKPEEVGIKEIIEHERTILEPKINYTLTSGISQEEANHLRKAYKKSIDGQNKLPKAMNFFREHMLVYVSQKK